MIIKNNYDYESVSDTVTKPVLANRLNLEILSTCSFTCTGCFVRKNDTHDWRDLDVLKSLLDTFLEKKMYVDELILGPVDVLGASNTRELFHHPLFLELMRTYKPILAMVTTFLSSEAELLAFIDLLNRNIKKETEIEFGIIINVEKVVQRDRAYLDDIRRKIDLLNRLQHPVTYTAKMNVADISGYSVTELFNIIKDEWDTIIDIVPSFFRTPEKVDVYAHLEKWNTYLEQQITPANKHEFIATIADNTHSGLNNNTWVIKKGELYFSPFIYDNIVDAGPRFRVPKAQAQYEATDIIRYLEAMWQQSFAFSEANVCQGCERSFSCTAKGIHWYMQAYGITKCMLPKKVLDIYGDDLGTRAHTFYNWEGYTLEDEIKNGVDYEKIMNKK